MPDPRTEPTSLERFRGAVARRLGRLPEPVQIALSRRRELIAVQGPDRSPVGAVTNLAIDGATAPLNARHDTPPLCPSAPPPLLVYFHGGGFVLGDLDTHDETCRVLCRATGHHLLSVDYRLAPEHPFPASLDDAVAAFRWAAVRPVAQLLIYPATDRTAPYPSHRHFDTGFFLSMADVHSFHALYTDGSGAANDDPRISPLRAPSLSGLPPALVVAAGFDVLRDEVEAYAAALAAAGTPCTLQREPSLGHGFVNLTTVSIVAHRAVLTMATTWQDLLR
jgi:acetyl esterase